MRRHLPPPPTRLARSRDPIATVLLRRRRRAWQVPQPRGDPLRRQLLAALRELQESLSPAALPLAALASHARAAEGLVRALLAPRPPAGAPAPAPPPPPPPAQARKRPAPAAGEATPPPAKRRVGSAEASAASEGKVAPAGPGRATGPARGCGAAAAAKKPAVAKWSAEVKPAAAAAAAAAAASKAAAGPLFRPPPPSLVELLLPSALFTAPLAPAPSSRLSVLR